MKIKAIITGATGMVGEGVLHECLLHPDVEYVLVINRKPCGVKHKKLKEIIHKDFFVLSSIEDQLIGYNACYFCAGVSSLGKKEDEYKRITYDLTMNFANTLVKLIPEMTFCYVSGVGTDSTEKGRSMWARVKGKTENDLMKLPFKDAYMFRPGYIQPTKGLKNTYKAYKIFVPLYPLIKSLFSKYATTLMEIGLAMINVTLYGSDKKVLECRDIVKQSQR
ncbi:MAG: epimerase [Ignavibacteria bacterium]|nr:epimerase [Ignavibacteria bacterium]MBT8383487.1 epimerase [Ignavibacteria bacterium]MBT8393101.1 epimerase [Ignavibacteria bacterium]NNJ52152.1 epimerase [Ignavibacteriaceae bacterium]NNL21905.1 epimerase [Ignavibacteriaceae bacterium]